ncbi:MAG: chromate transporter, partial [Verrucomicrobiales bacterium]|nr:chromate transporter [Verrucomicrobiales bacterium]
MAGPAKERDESIDAASGAITSPPEASPSLSMLALSFLRIGCLAFGGFMTLVGLVEKEFVQRRRLIRDEEMVDAISLVSLLPGPMAVNLVGWTGYRLRGWFGAFVSVTAIILPAFLLMQALGAAYLKFAFLPEVKTVFQFLLAALAAVVLDVAFTMARKNVTSGAAKVWAIVACIALLITPLELRFPALLVIIALGAVLGVTVLSASSHSTNETTAVPEAFQTGTWRRDLVGLAVAFLSILGIAG